MPVAHGETSVAMMRIYGAPRRLSGSVHMKSSNGLSGFHCRAEHYRNNHYVTLTKLLRMDKGPA